jgi:hypothetical protein
VLWASPLVMVHAMEAIQKFDIKIESKAGEQDE